MAPVPAANKIHSLPVLVKYQLPCGQQSYSTILSIPAQVYVHAHAQGKAQHGATGGAEEVWGSIYLKTVVQGVLMASPEIFPSSTSPDLSLYILDPRESASRRQRSSRLSSSLNSDLPISPNNPFYIQPSAAAAESSDVWAGKGLLSWALAEPGQGKNLITGRLCQRVDFSSVAAMHEAQKASGVDGQGLSPLEALLAAHQAALDKGEQEQEVEREAWGIEVKVQVRDNTRPVPNTFGGVSMKQSTSAQMVPGGQGYTGERRGSNVSASGINNGRANAAPPRIAPRPAYIAAASSSSAIQTSPIRPSDHAQLIGQKRKISHNYSHSADHNTSVPTGDRADRALTARDMNAVTAGNAGAQASTAGAMTKKGQNAANGSAIPAALFNDPSSMTHEQAKRLLESPSFLELLERTAHKPASAPGGQGPKKALVIGKLGSTLGVQAQAAQAAQQGSDAKRLKHDTAQGVPAQGHARAHRHTAHTGGRQKLEMKCWNCGRTKSSVWRSRTMEDGSSVRVCNACGLYWNNRKEMRPPSLWTAVDDEPNERPQRARKPRVPTGSTPAVAPKKAIAPAPAPSSSTGQTAPVSSTIRQVRASSGTPTFKRTLSAAVNEDARRMAAVKGKQEAGAGRKSGLGTAPVTAGTATAGGAAGNRLQSSPVLQEAPSSSMAVSSAVKAVAKSGGKSAVGAGQWSGTARIQKSGASSAQSSAEAFAVANAGTAQGEMPKSDPGFSFNHAHRQTQHSIPDHFVPMPTSATQHLSELDLAFNQNGNWDTDLSTLFDSDVYNGAGEMNLDLAGFDFTNPIGGTGKQAPPTPVRRSPRKHAPSPYTKTTGVRRRADRQGDGNGHASSDSAETRSNLFHTNSSAPNSPSPSRTCLPNVSGASNGNRTGMGSGVHGQQQSTFDFSTLPPSSPPMHMATSDGDVEGLEHSVMLLSSPEGDVLADQGQGQGARQMQMQMQMQDPGTVGSSTGAMDGTPLSLDPGSAPALVGLTPVKMGGVGVGVGMGGGVGVGIGVGVGVGVGVGGMGMDGGMGSSVGMSTDMGQTGFYGLANDAYTNTNNDWNLGPALPNSNGAEMEMAGFDPSLLEGISMDDLSRIINESGMDQAGWDELFGLVSQGHAQGQSEQGLEDRQQQQQQQQEKQGLKDGQEVLGQFAGDDWAFLNV